MRVIAIHNQKGGTAKTTTTINLGAVFAARGYRTLLLDVDSQGHLAEIFKLKSYPRTMYDLLIMDALLTDCAVKVRGNLDCIVSNATLAAAEIILSSREPEGRELILKRRMQGANSYDFVLIDCSPSLNLINQLALIYATELIIPISMDYLALIGAAQVLENINILAEQLGNEIELVGVVPTFVDQRKNITAQTMLTIERTYGDKVLPSIRIDTKIEQSIAAHKTIFEYDPRSKGAEDYTHLSEVLLSRGQALSQRRRERSRTTHS